MKKIIFKEADKTIHILMTVDDGFYNYLLVCLNSILDNTSNTITLYFTNRLSVDKVNYLKTISPQLTVIILDDEIISKSNSVYKGNKRWSSTVCDRLFAPFYINNIDRLIYLDVDTVVICDIAALYNIDLKGKTIGASGYSYFNSGVIVYDMNKLRDKYSYINTPTNIQLDNCSYPDQDYLNEVFRNDFHDIGFYYNYRAHNTFLWKNPKKHGGGLYII